MKKYKVDEKTFVKIKSIFGNYVFNRKDENGCFVKLSKSQLKVCNKNNFKLEEV